MKPASPELIALLATRQFYAVDLYTFFGGNLQLAGSVTRTGNVSSGSTTISSMSSVAGLTAGMPIIGPGIAPGTIVTVVGGSSLTISIGAYATITGAILNIGSTVLRFCSGDQSVTANGYPFSAGGQTGPYFDRQDNKAKIHLKIGTQVDTMTVDILPGSYTVFGVPFSTAVRYGIFDGCLFMLERCFMATYGDTRLGTVRQFLGRVSEISIGRSICTLTANSHLELLNLQMPRNLYTQTCLNNLGDKACGVNLSSASYHSNGTVTSGTQTQLTVSVSGGPFTTGQFNQGKIVFTSGVLNGLSATITSYSGSTLNLLAYLPTAPSGGDTFNIFFGCDKSQSGTNGCPKFSNQVRFRGMPYIPNPVTAA